MLNNENAPFVVGHDSSVQRDLTGKQALRIMVSDQRSWTTKTGL
jgi:hypothetical protein